MDLAKVLYLRYAWLRANPDVADVVYIGRELTTALLHGFLRLF